MRKLGLLLVIVSFMAAVFAGCAAPPQGSDQGQSIIPTIIFMVVIFAIFYFLMVRPQRRRQKQHEQMVQELQKGDQVVTAGGMYGQIESVSPDSFVIKVESGATIRVARSSVAGRREIT